MRYKWKEKTAGENMDRADLNLAGKQLDLVMSFQIPFLQWTWEAFLNQDCWDWKGHPFEFPDISQNDLLRLVLLRFDTLHDALTLISIDIN